MRIEPGQKICLDTNILLDATDEGRRFHSKALNVFTVLPQSGAILLLATQVIREYVVVATRHERNNGLGLSIEDATNNILGFQKRAKLIPEPVSSCEKLLEWAVRLQIAGKKLHDLQILATAWQANAQFLLTSNVADFPTDVGPQIVALTDLELP
jgi:predicted nucleic acid-binding protein